MDDAEKEFVKWWEHTGQRQVITPELLNEIVSRIEGMPRDKALRTLEALKHMKSRGITNVPRIAALEAKIKKRKS